MKIKYQINIFLFFLVFLFQGCSFNKNSLKTVAQTNSASEIYHYKNEVLNSLITYKKKLDLRNPKAYNRELSKNIYFQIESNQNYINIIQNSKKLFTSDEYLYYAFSKEEINNRNDFLILGMYKLIYDAYNLKEEHQFSAVQYNSEKMQKLYKYLQIIRWKVRTQKDIKGKFLFVTWQNNWQLEFLNKNQKDLNTIKDLKYIKNKQESIFSSSNFSFENTITEMLVNIKHTLKKINVEPYDMGISAFKSFVFII